MKYFLMLVAVTIGATGLLYASHADRPTKPPVHVFAELEGSWSGVFIGLDSSGRELYRIRVKQTYETISDTEQRVTIEDTMPDGTVITGEGANTATRTADGAWRLRCVVSKSNGDRVEHTGRLIAGLNDDTQLVWYSKAPNRTETFRETVLDSPNGPVYEINGMGRYGDTMILMHGRYTKTNTLGD